MASYDQRQPPPPTYGHCETFFVESDFVDSWYERKAYEREQARQQAKERQQVLAGYLSRVTSDEYQEDVLDKMELMEVSSSRPRSITSLVVVLTSSQVQTLPDVNSIDIQTEIQWFMRPFLLDFLVEAHSAFSLLPDTLYLAVNLLDRYCSRRVVYKRHYQLVGCAALLVAAKYGDRKDRVPQIKELKAMCCSLYEEDMFTQMEWHLLHTLDWVIGHPTIDSFLQVAMAENAYDPEIEHMSWYITELALFHKEFVSVLPSAMARSALSLARFILSKPAETSPWAGAYDPALVSRLYEILRQPSNVVLKKYSAYQLSSVAVKAQVFLQTHAERQRQEAPVTATIQVVPWNAPKPDSSCSPQTPQKILPYPVMNHGLYTPPITPENDNVHAGDAMDCGPHKLVTLPSMHPATPSPLSTAGHHPLQQYQNAYDQVSQDQGFWAT